MRKWQQKLMWICPRLVLQAACTVTCIVTHSSWPAHKQTDTRYEITNDIITLRYAANFCSLSASIARYVQQQSPLDVWQQGQCRDCHYFGYCRDNRKGSLMTVDNSECYITVQGHSLSHALLTDSRRLHLFLNTTEPQRNTVTLWCYSAVRKVAVLRTSSKCGQHWYVQGIIYGALERFLMTAVRWSQSVELRAGRH